MLELLRDWLAVDCRSSCVVHWLLSVCCGLCVMGVCFVLWYVPGVVSRFGFCGSCVLLLVPYR